eukprot:TRINITY_DN8840_c0_g1_i2.p1 TRINITY_DN8840_c0_g1~~TRINITY_DN8840_c0_g1_i2.p1  ORF type:complete len:339 (+),score=124.25 TRINITY_DN8840_c0_g1_i2:58-1074(+)
MDHKGILNDGFVYEDKITEKHDGISVFDFYCKEYIHSSPETWKRKIEEGNIFVDGNVERDLNAKLKKGQRLEYKRSPWIEPIIEGINHNPIEIIYESDQVVVFNKPSGLPVLPSGEYLQTTLLNYARNHYRSIENQQHVASSIAPVHRLGRGTSGAIIFSKTNESGRCLGIAMQKHEIKKKYRALVEGIVKEDEFPIDQKIGPVHYPFITRTGTINAASDKGKPSHSFVKVLKRDHENDTTLVEVDIKTGRPHQIRIHMAWAGYPLVGDPLYGIGGVPVKKVKSNGPNAEKNLEEERDAVPGDCGYWLHSWKISFPDPCNEGRGEMIHLICPVPSKLE